MLDVIVIGGGPIGSQTAYKLAEMGRRIAVLESRQDIGQKPCCTGILSQECINNYAFPPDVILRSVNSAKIVSPSGRSIQVFRPQPQAGIVNRPAFDRYLADRARKKGVEYLLNSKAESVTFLEDRVLVQVINSERLVLEAKAVVLACGFSSPLITRIGLEKIDYLVTGVQAEVTLAGLNEVEVFFNQNIAPGFFAWLVPTASERGLAGLLTRQAPGKRLRTWMKELAQQGKINAGDTAVRYAGVPLKPLSRTFGNRFLIVGDAAGQVKPTTGGGIYFGLISADIAAETLNKAIESGDLSANNLAQYEKSWKKRLSFELGQELFARRIYERLSNNQIEGLFRRIESSGMVDTLMKRSDVSFDWHGGLILQAIRLSAAKKFSHLVSFPLNLIKR